MASPNPSSENPSQGDFMRLFVEFQRQIYAYIRSLVPQQADAENVLQETAAIMWEKFSQFTPGTSFLNWGITIARLQVMYFRQQQRRNVLSFSQSFIEAIDQDAEAFADDQGELRQALEKCLEKLNATDRDLIARRYLPGAKVPAIAETLGRPLTTVYHALDRIRRALATCIEQSLQAEES